MHCGHAALGLVRHEIATARIGGPRDDSASRVMTERLLRGDS